MRRAAVDTTTSAADALSTTSSAATVALLATVTSTVFTTFSSAAATTTANAATTTTVAVAIAAGPVHRRSMLFRQGLGVRLMGRLCLPRRVSVLWLHPSTSGASYALVPTELHRRRAIVSATAIGIVVAAAVAHPFAAA